MAFMVVAIVVIFCLRWLCGEFAPCRCDVGRRCNLCERAGFWGARVAGTARAMRCAPRAPPAVRRARLGSEMRFFARGYLVAPRAGAFTQPFLAGSEGMGSGCCARARAGFGASGDGRGAARLSVDGLAKSRPKLRCVVRHPEIRFSTSASRPSHGAKARPYRVGAPKRALSCHAPLWLAELDAGQRVRTCPDLVSDSVWAPSWPPTRRRRRGDPSRTTDATGRQRTHG